MNDDFGTYGKTDEFLPAQHLGHDFGFKFGRAKVEHGRKTDDTTAQETIAVTSAAATNEFLGDDKLLVEEKVKSG